MSRWNRAASDGVLGAMRSPKPIRWLLAVAVAGALAAAPVSTVLACSCAMATIQDSFGFSDVVFTGTTTAVEAPPARDIVSSADPVRYAFAVDAIYKGSVTDAEIVATTALDGASCGTSFGMDERWLVFANVADGEIWTGLCSGNVQITDAAVEASIAGELGTPLVEPDPASSESAPAEIPLGLIVAVAAAAAVVGLSAWAFLREPRARVS
jgi:hypothetical protein